jgi:hypothetical protein
MTTDFDHPAGHLNFNPAPQRPAMKEISMPSSASLASHPAQTKTSIRFEQVLWLMPLAFASHIVEEFVGGFGRYAQTEMHGSYMPPVPFIINNAVFMGLLVALSVYATVKKSRMSALLLMGWASGNLFWDFLVHLYYTAATGVFSPGLITATFFYYPLPLIVSAIAIRQGRSTLGDTVIAYAIGATLMALVVWGGIYHFKV